METRTCPMCGKTFEVKWKSIKRTFCSRQCANKQQTIRMNATKKTFICENCGKTFERTEREIKNAQRNHTEIRFCCKKCKSDYWGRNRVEQTCCVCGKKFLWQKRAIAKHQTCSHECALKNPWNRNNLQKKNPTTIYRVRRSKQYIRWLRAIKNRDKGICARCDNPLGLPTQVHHIVPLYDICKQYNFVYEDIIESDELSNLKNGITLCLICHAKAHPDNVPMQKALEYETYLKQHTCRPESMVSEDSAIINGVLSEEAKEVFNAIIFDDCLSPSMLTRTEG